MAPLPPCGIYRTTRSLGPAIPSGKLVYFHNHGSPGAGVYLPSGWRLNRAQWHSAGTQIDEDAWAHSLQELPEEGLYRVREAFTCCQKNCRTFEPGLLAQLGFNGNGEPILFVPEWSAAGLHFPERGQGLDADRLERLDLLKVMRGSGAPVETAGGLLH